MKKPTPKQASKPIPTKGAKFEPAKPIKPGTKVRLTTGEIMVAVKPVRGKAANPATDSAKPKKGPGSGKPNAMMKAAEAAKADPSLSLWTPDPEADKLEHGHNGRPTVYTPTIGARILAWIASGQKMRLLWEQPGIPSEPLFYKWLSREGKEFDLLRESLARAREARAETRVGRIETVADRLVDAPVAGDLPLHPQAAKVFIDAQELLMRLESGRKYGKALTLKGDPESPLETRTRHEFSEAELEAILRGSLDQEVR